jgi:hypothetical protein
MRNRRPPFVPSCVPDDVLHDGVSWRPDWTELQFERAFRIKSEMDREWLVLSLQRAARISQEMDATKRRIAILEEQERVDAWHRKDVEENERLRVAYQELLDRPTLAAKKKRLVAASKEIAATDARIEKSELLRRGLVRGRRT